MGPHRPLPSIDVPLLREERMALRSRRLARAALLLAVVGGSAGAVLSLFWLTSSGDESESSAASTPPDDSALAVPLTAAGSVAPADAGPEGSTEQVAADPASAPVDRPRLVEQPFGQALGFRDAVEQAGLTRDESLAVIAALDGVLDFRRCQPDHILTLETDALGQLQRFAYKASTIQRYEAVRQPDGSLLGRQVEVPIRRVRVKKGGVISGSLGDALEGLGLKRGLAGVFVEVFDGHVAFTSDTRSGDTFRVIIDEEYVDDEFIGYGTVHALEFRGQKTGPKRAYWYESEQLEGDFYDGRGRAMHGGWLRTPLRYDHISSPFGSRMHPVLKRRMPHNGIDYAAPSGTTVKAAAQGVVTFAAPKGANGNLIVLRHDGGYETYYAHLLRFGPGIKSGVKVKQRQVIGQVGSTGRSTGPHLHFGLKQRGRMIDPASQLNGPGRMLPGRELGPYKRRVRDLSSQLDRIALETPARVLEQKDAAYAPMDGVDL